MSKKIFTQLGVIVPVSDDLLLIGDTQDNNNAKNSTIEDVVQAGLSARTSDHLPEGSTNKYMTTAEKSKLTGIESGAERNDVTSVNGQGGTVTLTQDQIPSGATYVQTENNYTDSEKQKVQNAQTHSICADNPHNVTKEQIGLENVLNCEQLTKKPDDYRAFSEVIALGEEDRFLIEDSCDEYAKKTVSFGKMIGALVMSLISYVTGSITVKGGTLQLVGDEVEPKNGYVYTNKNGNKGRHSPLTRYIYGPDEEINIPHGYQMIVHGGIKGGSYVTGGGLLVII